MIARRLLGPGLALWAFAAPLAAQTSVDPTRPPDYVAVAELPAAVDAPVHNWEVSMIRVSGAGAVAIVNGAAVSVGQQVDGATVTAISRRRVALEREGERFEVTLAVRDLKVAAGRGGNSQQGGTR